LSRLKDYFFDYILQYNIQLFPKNSLYRNFNWTFTVFIIYIFMLVKFEEVLSIISIIEVGSWNLQLLHVIIIIYLLMYYYYLLKRRWYLHVPRSLKYLKTYVSCEPMYCIFIRDMKSCSYGLWYPFEFIPYFYDTTWVILIITIICQYNIHI